MTANEKRQMVISKYKTILGRNNYSQTLRDYCYKLHPTKKQYYSDCSSSISYTYKEVFPSDNFGILNTVGMYQSKKLTDVPVVIKNGLIQNPEVLRLGDMLLFAGTDSSRAYAGYVGHVEMVYTINGSTVTLAGHGSGTPSTKNMNTYCTSRRNTKTSTALGNKGLIGVKRFIQDDNTSQTSSTSTTSAFGNTVTVTGTTVNIRSGPGTGYSVYKIARKGDVFTKADTDGWLCIQYGGKLRWVSGKYVSAAGECTGGSVNVRSGPGTQFSSVGIAKLGDRLEAVETTGWVPLVISNAVYWISEKYVK